MAWSLKGNYIGTCSCSLICPCAVDGPPTGPDGKCHGLAVWNISEGSMDGTDLSGLSWALSYFLPSNFGAGNVKMGITIDASASEDQEQALMSILSGQAGGPFADMAALISEVEGPERAEITFTGGDTPTATVEGKGELTFQALVGPDGSTPTTISNAMFGFAPTFRIGRSSGQATAFGGETYDAVYAETAEYEYSSETTADEIRPRA
jgi:hypothetical protein